MRTFNALKDSLFDPLLMYFLHTNDLPRTGTDITHLKYDFHTTSVRIYPYKKMMH
jgi:hypothetical protein